MSVWIVSLDFQKGPILLYRLRWAERRVLLMTEGVIRRIPEGEVFPLADFSYVAGLGTFGTIGDFKFNRITLFKGFEPFTLNGRVVDKYVLATFNFDKPKTLPVVEPFDASCHWNLHGTNCHGIETPGGQYWLPVSILIMY